MRAKVSAKDYRDLVAWKKAFELALAIYGETAHFPLEEKYGIKSQLRRAGISIPSIIAEGQGGSSIAEFLHHLSITRGSLKEAETQVLISEALGYFSPDQAVKLIAMAAEVGCLISGLSRSLWNR
jgi:four helix bundle protein